MAKRVQNVMPYMITTATGVFYRAYVNGEPRDGPNYPVLVTAVQNARRERARQNKQRSKANGN